MLARCRLLPAPKAITILKDWTHPRRSPEVNDDLLNDLKCFNNTDALAVLKQLKEKPFVISSVNNSSSLTTTISLGDSDAELLFRAHTLVDSGAQNCYKNPRYVAKHNLATVNLPRAIPVYNADGSLNNAGSITQYTEMWTLVADHISFERFYITNIGS
ncbi:hypothetical protein BKA70DRAFT_1109013, partial [Coprinopsis sp. MPI-PUGE-AT-0042]